MAKRIEMGYKEFDKVRNIILEPGPLNGQLGKFLAETPSYNPYTDSMDTDTNGVYIFQSLEHPGLAYRISKDFQYCNLKRDAGFIQKLQNQKGKIKLTEFPTGIITQEERIIGQEIPFYSGCQTILYFFQTNIVDNPIVQFKSILDALKEMYDAGIDYFDIHGNNFVLDPWNPSTVKTIDFDETYVSFGYYDSFTRKRILGNYLATINDLNRMNKTDILVGDFEMTDDFACAYEQLAEKEYILMRK